MRRALVVLGLLVVPLLVVGDASCTPAQRADLAPLVEPAERASCVLLRAFTTSGAVDSVCATADDLAPFVAELVAAQAAKPAEAAPAPVVAYKLSPPRRRVPRRRCVSWQYLDGPSDGGADAE